MKHVKRFDKNDWACFAGAGEFPGGGDPLTAEFEVWAEGSRRLVKMVGDATQVEFHWDVDGDPRALRNRAESGLFREHDLDALVGMVKETGSLEMLPLLGFSEE